MIVKCETCKKPFNITLSRQRKNKHHTCSKRCLGELSSKLSSSKVTVSCVICSKEIKYKQSHIKQISNPTCSRLCSGMMRSKSYNKDNNPRSLKLTDFERFFWDKATDLKNRAKAKKLDFNVTYKDLLTLYQQQSGKCHYSDLPLKIYKKGENIKISHDTLSVDRIDSSKGYTLENIVLCLNCINMLKAHHNLNDIKKVFKALMIKESVDISVKFKKLESGAQIPIKIDPLSSGYDLYVHRFEEFEEYVKVYTGIAIQPDSGYWFMLSPRSSSYKKGITLYNNLGIIDQNYTGEIIAIFLKTKSYSGINIGDRLVQLVPQKVLNCNLVEVSELSSTERGNGGFGSSGA